MDVSKMSDEFDGMHENVLRCDYKKKEFSTIRIQTSTAKLYLNKLAEMNNNFTLCTRKQTNDEQQLLVFNLSDCFRYIEYIFFF